MTLTVFLIDDEAPARRELRYLLEQLEGVAILGEASNPSQALRGIRETRPQLVFLDIQLPGVNGIDLAQIIRELPGAPLIVFATAFQEFAVQAFAVDAFDYILKPFTLERVAKSVQKGALILGNAAAPLTAFPAKDQEAGQDKSGIKRVLVQKGGKMIPIAPESIVYISAVDGEARVHSREGAFTSRSTLSTLESLLEPYSFARVHRNSLVNLNCIIEIIPWFSGSCKLVLNDSAKSEVLVSRYHTKGLKQLLLLGN
jgi:DNA-binding LytR/AlgR family response regulator